MDSPSKNSTLPKETRPSSGPSDKTGILAPNLISPSIQTVWQDSWPPLPAPQLMPTRKAHAPLDQAPLLDPQTIQPATSHEGPSTINHYNLEDKVGLAEDGNDRNPPRPNRIKQRPKWLVDYNSN
ncbi:hypothetical protein TanjilG_08555 [Lupinus angustifolius]|uniref:Uncharacterized protein n=1 Tax=Lupinus angustifolius TaxID=3871 RepID=A0A1J7HYU5_LUPAN|nr:hypothetical protein TanjilG_08555 [Lupinus angustifolius]